MSVRFNDKIIAGNVGLALDKTIYNAVLQEDGSTYIVQEDLILNVNQMCYIRFDRTNIVTNPVLSYGGITKPLVDWQGNPLLINMWENETIIPIVLLDGEDTIRVLIYLMLHINYWNEIINNPFKEIGLFTSTLQLARYLSDNSLVGRFTCSIGNVPVFVVANVSSLIPELLYIQILYGNRIYGSIYNRTIDSFGSTQRSVDNNKIASLTDIPDAAQIKLLYESNDDTNAFTDSEKLKLSGLEGSKWVGQYISLEALQVAYPTAPEGSYAYVDAGEGTDVKKYIWDSSDNKWVLSGEVNQELIPVQVKTLYESNDDTNAFTDDYKELLDDIPDLLEGKVDTQDDKDLSTNDFDNVYKGKIDDLVVLEQQGRVVFVAKYGNDANDGTRLKPMLTLTAANTRAATLIGTNDNRVAIVTLDTEIYSESFTLANRVYLIMRESTLVGSLTIGNFNYVYIHRHYPSANSQTMVSKSGAEVSYYECSLHDGRGLAGNLTGVINVSNTTNTSILYFRCNMCIVGTNGCGFDDSSSTTGHTHITAEDIYLSTNAIAIRAQSANSHHVVNVHHILPLSGATGTVGFQITNAGGKVIATVGELNVATAWNNVTPSADKGLTLNCLSITGTRTGTATIPAPSNAQKNSDITKAEIEAKLTGAITTHKHSYNNLDDLPTIPTIPDLLLNDNIETSGKYISKIEVDGTNKHKLNITKKDLPQGFSGSYEDLTNRPTIPTKTSDLTNDSGFLTALPAHNHDTLYYKKSETYTKTQTDALVGNLTGETKELKSITTQPSGTFVYGDLYYNSSTKGLYYYTGSAWELTGAGEPLPGVIYSFNGTLYFWNEAERDLIQIGGGVDLSNYYTKTEIDAMFDNLLGGSY